MRKVWHSCLLMWLVCGANPRGLIAQEAAAGVDLRATVTGQTIASNVLTEKPRSGSPMIAGFRSVVYPTIKMSDHWFVTGAYQFSTRPYLYDELSTTGYGAKGNILQATLNYSRVSQKGSYLMRAGELSTAFGSFMLHYDDAENALVDLPPGYGYYYAPISTLAVAGAQIDATRGKWDGRAQFANSSPANPRSVFAPDQYGNWAGGFGYTLRQGFRVGVSGYRGPYLDRKYAYFFPGEAKPSSLKANALGIDVGWSHGHSSAQGELQKFVMPYKLIPTFREKAGYGEFKQVLSPRWYVAGRAGFTSTSVTGKEQIYEMSAAFRPDRHQSIKVGYQVLHYSASSESNDQTLAIQFITTFHVSAAHD
jgi:hypothetical protein